jgi:hypothetical protein
MELSLMEKLCFSTTRIEAYDNQGIQYTGTCFFFELHLDSGHSEILLVTNRHMIEDDTLKQARFLFTEANEKGEPIVTRHIKIEVDGDLKKSFKLHPNPKIDLCVLPINAILEACKKIGKRLFLRAFDSSLIPSEDQIEQIDAVEEIIMIGYPCGLWDKINNMPLVRRGITATHFKYDYNGESNFMIDAACLPGSSGSPVIIHKKWYDKNNQEELMVGKSKIYLAGVLYGTPDTQQATNTLDVPNNLGIVIKSKHLLEFKNVLS